MNPQVAVLMISFQLLKLKLHSPKLETLRLWYCNAYCRMLLHDTMPKKTAIVQAHLTLLCVNMDKQMNPLNIFATMREVGLC